MENCSLVEFKRVNGYLCEFEMVLVAARTFWN